MKNLLIVLLTCLPAALLFGQGSALPLGNPAYHIINRLQIKTGRTGPLHSALKPYSRGAVTRLATQLDTAADAGLSRLDHADLRYIFLDNNEWLGQAPFATTLAGRRVPVFPDTVQTQIEASLESKNYIDSKKPIFNLFYRSPANLLEVNDRSFHLRLDPILNLKGGAMQDEEDPFFFNQRGLELRGGIDDRIYFYTQVLETQAAFPQYVRSFVSKFRAVPGAGLYKSYQSDVFGIKNGLDFLNGQGYLGFNISRHVGLQFGYGRNFIGDGYRSTLLSDFSNNNLYLKLNTHVWKIHYQNIFGELTINTANSTQGDNQVDRKYFAAHYLSIDILPNLNAGIFEAVVFDRPNQFELQYLNPIILYRTIEQAVGSPDNVLLGFNARWNFLRHFQLYGQMIFDEFKFRELTNGEGWWGNKFSVQAGAKYIDAFGIDHLDLQAEYNLSRPYTYTHFDSTGSYSHYHQSLAHPLGANFNEWIGIARYQPLPRLVIEGRLIGASFGEDSDTTNWGMNILLPNTTREREYGNTIGQGIAATTLLAGLDISYQLSHNVFIDLHYFYRRKDSELDRFDQKTQYISGGIRVNIGMTRYDF